MYYEHDDDYLNDPWWFDEDANDPDAARETEFDEKMKEENDDWYSLYVGGIFYWLCLRTVNLQKPI